MAVFPSSVEVLSRPITLFSVSICALLIAGCAPREEVPIEPTLESIQQYVLTPSCGGASCHLGSEPIHDADFNDGESYANLVYQTSFMEPDYNLVEPGDPDNSLLVQKLEGTAVSSIMPLWGIAIEQYKIDAIRQWITSLPIVPQPTLRYIQKNIFDVDCATSTCHSASAVIGGLDLSAGNALDNLLGVDAVAEAYKRIEAGDPDSSYLVHKLEGSHSSGSSMPMGQPALSAEKIAAVRAWILTLTGPQPTIEWLQPNVFDVSCAYVGCHDGEGNLADYGNEYALANMLNVDSVYEPSYKVIVAGNPDNSYLIKKLEGSHQYGLQMPWLAPPLPQGKINAVRDWISAMAANCDAVTTGVNWSAVNSDCPNLADYNLFADPSDPLGATNSGGVPYDLTSPLFTDYAHKHRQIFVPPGQQIQYNGGDLIFPEDTIITKTFFYQDDETNPQVNDIVETRLLINRGASGWRLLPYIWNGAQADLALQGGGRQVSWIDGAGQARSTAYKIPHVALCSECHRPGDKPLGPTVPHINDPYDYGTVTENQISHWAAAGILSGAPLDPSGEPRHPVWSNPTDGSLEERALAYLETNCGHCHRQTAGIAAGTGLFLMVDQAVGLAAGICKPQIESGVSTGGLTYDIVPGLPAESILVHRMESLNPAVMMPELAKTMVHTEGVQLISDWITGLTGSCP